MQDDSNEFWKDIKGYEGAYQVSSQGRVRALRRRVRNKQGWCYKRERILKLHELSCGHLQACLSYACMEKRFLIHRLVLMTFVGHCPKNMEGCHNDGNPKNNHVDNLRWDTRKNNEADKDKHGTRLRLEQHPRAKLNQDKVIQIRKMHSDGFSMNRLAKMFGVNVGTIIPIIKHKTWKF